MCIKSIALAATTLDLSTSVNAALIERLGGLAYYDDVADLTWLADANYAQTIGRDADGLMSWYTATTWLDNLNVGGHTGWRLPTTPQFDTSCSFSHGSGDSGSNCIGSEMGNLFYNVLGGTAGDAISITHNNNYELFTNIQDFDFYRYWSNTLQQSGWDTYAWGFRFNDGEQFSLGKSNTDGTFTWGVHSGDVGEIITPVPAAIWLFGSGLIGLIGVARRKKS